MSTPRLLLDDPRAKAQAIFRPGFAGPQYILSILGRPPARGTLLRPVWGTPTYNAVRAILTDAGVWAAAKNNVWGRIRGRWQHIVSSTHGPAELLRHTLVPVVVANPSYHTRLLDMKVPSKHDSSTLEQFLEAQIAELEGAYVLEEGVPDRFANPAVIAPGAAPELSGAFLNHPFQGTPRGLWLTLTDPELPTPSPDFPHWRTIFSALNLPPHSLYPLVAYCLACYHAVSLDFERLVLVVDSWHRARGKTEVCSVLGTLLDGVTGTLDWPPNQTTVSDTVIAHLAGGKRTLLINNLHGHVAWHNPTIASAATDGQLQGRPKYGSTTAGYDGIVIAASFVYGATSVDPDLLSRCLRVELPGPAQALNPRPRDYARDHRDALAAEALAALPHDIPTLERPHTRAAEFEAVGSHAAARALGVPLADVCAAVGRALERQAALTPTATQSLYAAHPSAFDDPLTAVVGTPFGRTQPAPPAGAAALGYRYTGTAWEAEA